MGPLTTVLDALLRGLKTGDKDRRGQLHDLWPQIAGKSFSPHTKALLQKGGTLCVWADDSVLAYELSQKYSGTILKRAQEALGEEAIKRIIFRVGQIR